MQVEASTSPPGSPTPAGGPLQVTSPDRVDRRDSRGSALRSAQHQHQHQQQNREGTVHDKISQFNNLSVSMQSRALERKTADAALKRALVGREEAETEARRLREEARALKKAIDEGKERERKVGERLEAVMENFGRAKETHAHTQALWEKEIRRSRKENFKAQSSIVKLQEDLKTSREALKSLQQDFQQEKERGHAREQASNSSTTQLARATESITRTEKQLASTQQLLESTQQQLEGTQQQLESTKQQLESTKQQLGSALQQLDRTQEQQENTQEALDKTQAQIKAVEQERDAYKAAAKNEEIARIAAEGRIPLPASDDNDEEFASPPKKKARRGSLIKRGQDPRVSLTSMEIVSSAASELEIEELNEQVEWERQRADRAQEMIEFMQAECLMHCCPCSKSKRRATLLASQEQSSRRSPGPPAPAPAPALVPVPLAAVPLAFPIEPLYGLGPSTNTSTTLKENRGRALSPNFIPRDGIFRNVSEQDGIALKAQQEAEIVSREPMEIEMGAPTLGDETDRRLRLFARTPSVEPPTFALHAPERTSLLSLINAPRGDALADAVPVTYSIPTLPDTEPAHPRRIREEEEREEREEREDDGGKEDEVAREEGDKTGVKDGEALRETDKRKRKWRAQPEGGEEGEGRVLELGQDSLAETKSGPSRPQTSSSSSSSSHIHTITTTTTVPLRDTARSASSFFTTGPRAISTGSNASFDQRDPGMIPTVTREQALAMIRERRGRARSATQLAPGPSLKAKSRERRDMSAPTGQAAKRQRRS